MLENQSADQRKYLQDLVLVLAEGCLQIRGIFTENNSAGLCMAAASAVFTKAILQFLGSDYLIANTVLCAMIGNYSGFFPGLFCGKSIISKRAGAAICFFERLNSDGLPEERDCIYHGKCLSLQRPLWYSG